MSKRNTAVQVLRAILFGGIVAFHCGVPGAEMFWCGVPAFFGISSYYLTRNLQKQETISLRRFVKKRLARLYPAYLLVLLIAIVFSVVDNLPMIDCLVDFGRHAIFVNIFFWMSKVSALLTYTAHTWTLALEIWLFFIWVVAFTWLRHPRKRIFFNYAMIFLSWVFRFLGCMHDSTIGGVYSPLFHLDAFAWGSLLAQWQEDGRGWKIRTSALIAVGGGGVLLWIAYMSVKNQCSFVQGYKLFGASYNYLADPVLCNIYGFLAPLFVGVLSLFLHWQVKGNLVSLLSFCGDHSYTAYLLHWVFIHHPGHSIAISPLDRSILVFCASILCAVAVDHVISAVQASWNKKKEI